MDQQRIRQDGQARIGVASYNVHSCVGMDRAREPSRIAAVIRELGCEILALQELDNQPGSGAESMQLQYLADALEMTAIPGLRMIRRTGEYGNALLTRFPVSSVNHIDLSYRRREPRGAIDARIDIGGRTVRIIASHLGLRRAERQSQWHRIMEAVAEDCTTPTFVLGDMNEWYRGARTLKEAHRLFGEPTAPAAFPSVLPFLALTRIWVRPVIAIASIEAHRTALAKIASDHLPVKATIDLHRL